MSRYQKKIHPLTTVCSNSFVKVAVIPKFTWEGRTLQYSTNKKLAFLIQVFYLAVWAVLLFFAWKAAGLIWPFLAALVLVGCIHPLVKFLHRKIRVNQKVLSVGFLALLYGGIGFLLFFLCTRLVFWLQGLFYQLPGYYQSTIQPLLGEFQSWVQNWFSGLPVEITSNLETIGDSLTNALTGFISDLSQQGISLVTGWINGIPELLISIAFVILMSFFVSLHYDTVVGFLRRQLPQRWIEKWGKIKQMGKSTLKGYLKAVLILMLCTFVELCIGFFILRVDNPLGIAALIAIFDALPLLGTGGIMIPWIIIELLSQNYSLALGLAILYAVVTVIRNLIEPKVVGDQLGLHPVVSLLAIYLGYRLLGVVGMILFPILAQLLILLHKNGMIRLYREKPREESSVCPS